LSVGKGGVKHSGRGLDAMLAVAKATEKASLELFKAAVAEYEDEVSGDPLVNVHLSDLFATLQETNLLKIIQPFSCIEIARIAELIKLPMGQVERKLSQMILDGKLHGVL